MFAIKTDPTWQATLVHADTLLDAGDDAGAERWHRIGQLQCKLAELWAAYGSAWTPIELRHLSMHRRTKHRKGEMDGRPFVVRGWFAPNAVILTLYTPSEGGPLKDADGVRYALAAETEVRRTTIARRGDDAAFRAAAERLAR